jgi:peptidoglycan/xylan/chitin deacetylase (PgdA/CDA1 family)
MIRSLAKTIYVSALSLLQADRFQIARLLRSDKIVVLNFHRVSPEANPFWPPMQPAVFDEFVRYLTMHFHVCLFRELDKVKPKKPIAVLSFDDGYYDFLEYALPVLYNYKVSANLNIIPECAESGLPIWNVRLYDFLRETDIDTIGKIELPGFDGTLSENSLRAKLRYGLAVSRFLKNKPRSERETIWPNIQRLIDRASIRSTRMLSTDEIRQLAETVEIGVHSYSHDSMGFESDDFFTNDFTKCQSYFADRLNLPLSIYAFPNGSYRESQIDFLRSVGISHILLVDEKFANPKSDLLTRRTMYGDSLMEVRLNALGL